MKRLAMIVNSTRKDTTGVYFLEAMRPYNDVGAQQFYLNEKIEKPDYDAYILFDCGLPIDTAMYANLKPLYYYAIDTHLGFEERLNNAKKMECKKVYLAQKNDVQKFIDAGVNTEWLPLACDPIVHYPWIETQKIYDVCFVGHVDPKMDCMQGRMNYLDRLFREFPNFYFGQKYMRGATDMYASSNIVFNCSVGNDVNMRIFEASCSGSILVTEKVTDNGMEELGFIDGENILMYNDVEDMVKVIRYTLDNLDEGMAIAKKGQELVISKHKYSDRMKKILDDIYAS